MKLKSKDFLIAAAWILAVFAIGVSIAYAVSTNTVTTYQVPGQDMKIVTVTWHDNDSLNTGTSSYVDLNGYVHQVVTRPHVDSTIQPQANYDINLFHGHTSGTVDLIFTVQNRSNSAIEYYFPTDVPFVTQGTVQHINSSVTDASGAIDFYVTSDK